jgi:hypothetical protein
MKAVRKAVNIGLNIQAGGVELRKGGVELPIPYIYLPIDSTSRTYTTTLGPYRALIIALLGLDTFPTYEVFLYKVFTLGEVLIDYTY